MFKNLSRLSPLRKKNLPGVHKTTSGSAGSQVVAYTILLAQPKSEGYTCILGIWQRHFVFLSCIGNAEGCEALKSEGEDALKIQWCYAGTAGKYGSNIREDGWECINRSGGSNELENSELYDEKARCSKNLSRLSPLRNKLFCLFVSRRCVEFDAVGQGIAAVEPR